MPGLAQTDQFLLSTGTVMIGPSSKVMELTPALHSVGLVKNVQTVADPQFVDLMQGVDNQLVYSVNTNNQVRVSMEVYEYTKRNLAYALGLDASGAAYDASSDEYTLNTAITTGGASVVLGSGEGADFAAGDFVVIQERGSDKLHVGKVASIATDTLTLATGYVMPSTMTFATATTVIYKVKAMSIGANNDVPALGAKVVGLLPQGKKPVTIIFPKIRITRGFSLSFQSDQFSNLPFEFVPFSPLPTDPFYADFAGKQAMVLRQ